MLHQGIVSATETFYFNIAKGNTMKIGIIGTGNKGASDLPEVIQTQYRSSKNTL